MATQSPGVEYAYQEVRERLRVGRYRPGARLPGERGLAADVGVSRATLRAALNRLAREGLVAPSQKRGWFVPRTSVSEPPNTLLSFSEMAATRGLTAQARMLRQVVRPSTFEEAELLGLVPSAQVIELCRLRSMDHVPVCVDRSVIAHSLARGLEAAPLEDASLYRHLADVHGFAIFRSSYTLRADQLDAEHAALLGVAEGSPALVARETTYTEADDPLLTATLTYRADAYRFEAQLYRPRSRR
jgi:GntR family transcriptional regulator